MSCTGRVVGVSIGAAVVFGASMTAPVSAATDTEPQSVVSLSVGPGVTVDVVNKRLVSLICAPTVGGTHPKAKEACKNLEAADGNIRELADFTVPPLCSQDFDPVVATIDGVWRGQPISDHGFFSNTCVLRATTVSVFDF